MSAETKTTRAEVMDLADNLGLSTEEQTSGTYWAIEFTTRPGERFVTNGKHRVWDACDRGLVAEVWSSLRSKLTEGTEPCYDARDAECVERECFDEDERSENLELNRLAEMDEDADRKWRMDAETERENQ